MDDVRAVMDAVGAERAALRGRVRGRADVRAVRGDAPAAHPALVDDGLLRAPQLGAGLPDRAPAGAGRLAAADRGAVGPLRRAALPRAAGAVDRRRRGGDRVVRVLPRARREPVGRGGDHRHERGDRRRPVLPTVRVPSLVLYREHEYLREAAATWASGCRARGSSRCRASTTCRGRATRRPCSTRSSCSSAACTRRRRTRGWCSPPCSSRTCRSPSCSLRESVLARFRGRVLSAAARACAPASTARPAPLRCATALADNVPALKAGIHTGECELRDGLLSGPGARGRRLPGRDRTARRDPHHLDGAGPRRRLRDRLRRARRARRAPPLQRRCADDGGRRVMKVEAKVRRRACRCSAARRSHAGWRRAGLRRRAPHGCDGAKDERVGAGRR